MIELLLSASLVLGPAILSPADPGVLEAVEARRVRYGWGLSEAAPEGTVLLAVDDCTLLGANGWMWAAGDWWPVAVVDCCNAEHTPLSELGLVADVNDARLGHQEGIVYLWQNEAR